MPDQSSKTPSRIAFSYERVSSREQAKKGKKGIQRQHEDFVPFCERHGLTPNPSAIQDKGLSAYHAQHLKRGALQGFLKAAEDKKIPWGSVLVVEDWSRFSRRQASYSQEMLQQLWSVGCSLAWVREDVVITRERFDQDQALRIKLDLAMQAAHDFSKGLSKTNTQVWELREKDFFENGVKYLSLANAPDWVEIRDGDFRETERSEWMRDVFKLRLEGKGSKQIALAMNDLGRKMSEGKNFSEGRVGRILRDRRLLGEKKFRSGRIAPNYFPRVIDKRLWDSVQSLVDQKPGGTGRGDTINNILQGITRCTCGGALSWQGTHRNKQSGEYRYHYLVCQRTKNGTCTAPKGMWKYDEELLLHGLMDARWEAFFDTPADTRKISERQNLLRDQEQQKASLDATVENIRANLQVAMGDSVFDKESIQLMTTALKDAQKTQASAQAAIDELHREIEVLSLAPSGREMKKEVQRRTQVFLANLADLEHRRNFNNWVNTLGVTVELAHKTRLMRILRSSGEEQLEVYRESVDIVLDQVKQDAEVLGVDLGQP